MNRLRRMIGRLALLLVAAVVVLVCCQYVEACPTCKDGLAGNDPQAANMARGYFWSILFMMSMPFLILAGLSSYFYWEIRRARREGEGSSGPLGSLRDAVGAS